MNIGERLNRYLARIGCTAKELAAAAGVSEVQLSRWRTGKQTPSAEQAALLAAGIVALLPEADEESVRDALIASLAESAVDSDRIIRNLNSLTAALNLRSSALARELSFDASYLSRIKSGRRRPANLPEFVDGVCRYVVRRYYSEGDLSTIASLVGTDVKLLTSADAFYRTLVAWIYGGELKTPNTAENFLKKLNDFDFNAYIRAIRFDEMRLPAAAFQLPMRHNATGLKDMMETELNFLKATVLSRSGDPVLLYSDMPMEKMSKDPEFPKKWMYGMAALLKKGLHLNIIHNVDRPVQEMMLGLEAYIPMYMTGQISPYYLPAASSKVFHYLLEVSGGAALEGTAIVGHHAEGKYYLTNNRDELLQYRARAEALLSKARPLMDIYRTPSERQFRDFLQRDFQPTGSYRLLFSAPPLFTIADELLKRIIAHNDVPPDEAERIMEYASFQKSLYTHLSGEGYLTIEAPDLDRAEFAAYPLSLTLSGMFYETDVFYTYEEYREHLRQTLAWENGGTIKVQLRKFQPFRNIQIIVNIGKWALVSKSKAPAIHFVVRHPKMVEAIERFTPLILESP